MTLGTISLSLPISHSNIQISMQEIHLFFIYIVIDELLLQNNNIWKCWNMSEFEEVGNFQWGILTVSWFNLFSEGQGSIKSCLSVISWLQYVTPVMGLTGNKGDGCYAVCYIIVCKIYLYSDLLGSDTKLTTQFWVKFWMLIVCKNHNQFYARQSLTLLNNKVNAWPRGRHEGKSATRKTNIPGSGVYIFLPRYIPNK